MEAEAAWTLAQQRGCRMSGCRRLGYPEGNQLDHGTGVLAHFGVQIKFADGLGSVWVVDGYCVGSFEGPVCWRLGCDHSGKGCAPWNDLLCIAPVEVLMLAVDRLMRALCLGRGPDDTCCRRYGGPSVNRVTGWFTDGCVGCNSRAH